MFNLHNKQQHVPDKSRLAALIVSTHAPQTIRMSMVLQL